MATPNITQVLPQTIVAGSKSVTMKVTGTNFTSQSVILWNGSALTTSVVDANTLAGSVSNSNVAAPSTAQLQVQNPETMESSQSVPVVIAMPVSSASSSPLTISTSSLPQGTAGKPYSTTLTATGGTPSYTWSLIKGQLPAGLNLSTSGVISGTPVSSGSYSFAVLASDSGSTVQTALGIENLSVAAAQPPANPTPQPNPTPTPTPTPTPPPNPTPQPTPTPLSVSGPTVLSGTVGAAYSGSIQISGGTKPYAVSVAGGSGSGLGFNSSTDTISGVPTASGTVSFTITVADSSSPQLTSSVQMQLTISPAALTIGSSSLASGVVGSAYQASLIASGGTSPYSWKIASGNLPTGLALATNGVVSGTPTASGTVGFTATVEDAGGQSASTKVSLSIAAAPLTITTTLPSGTNGTAYSSPLGASGGQPAYSWSITSGSLPAGLTLSATTGVISGIPISSGTFTFTASVSDNSTPVQSKSASASIVVAAAQASAGPGTTWYIRPDGGTRYSANAPTGNCDGKADAAYSGSGTNQHCAFNDYRFLYDDQSYLTSTSSAWVIAGGDTVIIRGGPYRVGVEQGTVAATIWCAGTGNPYACTNPVIPAGTPTQHTRILGENYGSCSQSNMTQLYGGFGVGAALNLGGAQYVDVECIELTRHSQCTFFGAPASPPNCSRQFPLDDYATNGITTDVNSHDVLLQDMWIHGFTSRGIIGPIGGLFTATRVDIAYNGGAGWDFDDGSETVSVNGNWVVNGLIVEWNGCNQQYPGTGAASCYGQSNGGYGDGVGTPPGSCFTASVTNSTFRYNTQDGLDLLHNNIGSCSLTVSNSTSYGNNGQAYKFGPGYSNVVFTNNTAVANCQRLSAPMTGQPSTYNANLGDFCRAYDGIAIDEGQGASILMANNTIVSYAPTTYDIECGVASCSNTTLTFENNISYGYNNTSYNYGGSTPGPGLFYFVGLGPVVRSNNVYYGFGHGFSCPTGNNAEYCEDPLFTNEPVFTSEQSLDNFDFSITPGSPAKGAGMYLPMVPLDFTGATRGNPPSIGAYEQ